MNFGFVTCVQLGKSCMEAIYDVGGELKLAITLEDNQAVKKSGRVYLDEFCQSNSIHLVKSTHINNQDCINAIKKREIDWLLIIGWSQIANKEILSAPKKGVLGIHPTLLPQGRGRASIPWAILKGLKETGVTLFKLDEDVDTGEILEQLVIPLSDKTTATQLYESVNLAHVQLIKTVFPQLKNDQVILQIQDEDQATEWPGRGPSEGEIDLIGSIQVAARLIRSVTRPYPGAFAFIDMTKYIIWKARILNRNLKKNEVGIVFKDGVLLFEEYEVVNQN